MNVEREKQLAAMDAATLVQDGMRVGLGTGSTVAYLLSALARRDVKAVYVATSPETEARARSLGVATQPFDTLNQLDLAIDGADQVSSDGWLIKGGGGAHTREKVVAASATRFVVIVDSTKLVAELRAPVPLELMAFGLASTLSRIEPTVLRDAPASPDGGVIADFFGDVQEYAALAKRLSQTPGVIEHGLFSPEMVSEVIVGSGDGVRHLVKGGSK
jgi:ribose 5-phosphate isomerase A